MKKLLLSFVLFLVSVNGFANYQCDAILTTENFQISCVLADVDESNIYYLDCQNPEEQTRQSVSVSNVRKLYLANGTIVDYTKSPIPDVTTIKSAIKQNKTKKVTPSSPSETPAVANKQTPSPVASKPIVLPTPTPAQPEPTTIIETRTPDIIITSEAKKIEAKILEVSKTEIRYKENDNLEGPTFVLSTEDINSIIYSNGKVALFNQTAPSQPQKEEPRQQPLSAQTEFTQPAQPSQPVQVHTPIKEDLNLARVETYGGVCVFTDCVPLSKYEVLGDITFSSSGEGTSLIMTGHLILASGETPQYTDIRNGLVSQAVLANRQVEGIIITITHEGQGKATMIKFADTTEDKTLAKVNSHLGVFVFTDCSPINTYSSLGKINGAGGVSSDYNILRDRLIKKSIKKFADVQGIIPRFVSGGKDTAEAIKF